MSRGLTARIAIQLPPFNLDLDLDIAEGETVALLGPNGAGKSTALEAIAGLRPIDAGSIMLDDLVLDDPTRDLFVPPERRQIGVVFQDYALLPHLSALDNVAFGPRSLGTARRPAAAAAATWLDTMGIGHVADTRPSELSGGEAQRVALARALATQPRLLLLDEPLAALDAATRVEMRHLLSDHLRAFAGPKLLITHDPLEAYLLADRIYVVESGAITQVGGADDIRLRPRTRYAADLAGLNLLVGHVRDGIFATDGHELQVAEHQLSGAAIATIHPTAISIYLTEPEGSPRNSWPTSIDRLEHYGERVRVRTGNPLPLTAEVTPEAVDALDLETGATIWVSVKATEIAAQTD